MPDPTHRPRPWHEVPPAQLRRVTGVLTDIDDTLTEHGRMADEALAALASLRAAQIPVIAITGRPMGWSLPFVRDWPVTAIVAENGSVVMFMEGDHVRTEYSQDDDTRARNARRLQQAAQRVLREVPGATLAQDSPGRVTDIAIDHGEYAHLTQAQIDAVVQVMQQEGMNATVSSIHVNGWYGEHTKLSGARWSVQRLLERELDRELDRWIYVGDSTNDQLMFGHLPLSVGVANLMDYSAKLHTWPSYITRAARGAGFAEVAAALLAGASPRAPLQR
jgi:HAD superfamily hydrolase (TIGR01484 family)